MHGAEEPLPRGDLELGAGALAPVSYSLTLS